MTAFSAGGRRAATCSPLKPPQDLPIIPTLPRAPGLGRDPGDHLERVVLLLPQILVEQHPFGFAAAAHVDADRGVAVAGEIGVHRLVARGGAVALAVGDVLQDRRHGIGVRSHRQPVAAGEPGAVGERDPGVVHLADAVRQLAGIDDPRGLLVHAQRPSLGRAHHHAASGK